MNKSIPELVRLLNYYTEKYDEGHPKISDKEWDAMYFELLALETEAGYALPDSPTQKITYSVVNSLEKVEHNHKMLSLAKTKALDDVQGFLSGKCYIAMAKMDGLTCSLKYSNGRLVAAETRGNGIVGENVLHNAQVIHSIPKHINYREELIVDGEIICTYENFKNFSNEYSNPRNFAAGSIRLLDSTVCTTRKLKFVAWDVIKGLDKHITHRDPSTGVRTEKIFYITNNDNYLLSQKLNDLKKLGFTTAPCVLGTGADTCNTFENINEIIMVAAANFSYPIDGVVYKFNEIEYGKSLGETAHHFKNAIAYKFYDEEYETKLENIEWQIGRKGQLTPVAVFKPVMCDDAELTRASLHNLSVLKDVLGIYPYVDQPIWVARMNMVIPQITRAEKADERGDHAVFVCPTVCPICGAPLSVNINDMAEVLYCTNESCTGSLLQRLDHFCSKKGLDIKGLSESTLEKLMDWGWVNSIKDIFTLGDHKAEWVAQDGFGEKSVDKILAAIKKASEETTLSQFISALGIPLIGQAVAKLIAKEFPTWSDFLQAIEDRYNFATIPTFGEAKANALLTFNYAEADYIVTNYLPHLMENQVFSDSVGASVEGLVFCITGKLTQHKNREELKNIIEGGGGRVVDSISSKVNYLINNDINSLTSKNKKAKELNIPIINEEKFVSLFC